MNNSEGIGGMDGRTWGNFKVVLGTRESFSNNSKCQRVVILCGTNIVEIHYLGYISRSVSLFSQAIELPRNLCSSSISYILTGLVSW